MTSDRIYVVAAVIRQDDTYLVCRRPAHKRHGGLWEFPGGKLDLGETPSEAIARELQEELAVQTSAVGPLLFTAQDVNSCFVIQFYPVRIAGDPVAIEHDEFAWVSVEELRALPLAPSDREFARNFSVLRSGF